MDRRIIATIEDIDNLNIVIEEHPSKKEITLTDSIDSIEIPRQMLIPLVTKLLEWYWEGDKK